MNNLCLSAPLRASGLALAILLAPLAMAAPTDIATAPLWSSVMSNVKPNVLFTLDDSGSMQYGYLPDDAGNFYPVSWIDSRTDTFYWAHFGYLSPQCNGLAYDKTVSYLRPVDATGTTVGAGSPTSSELTALFETSDASANTVRAQLLDTEDFSPVSSGPLSVTLKVVAPADYYFVNQPVTVYDYSAKGRYMVGLVTSWDRAKKLTIDVKQARGTSAMTTPVVAYGTPTNQLVYEYTGTEPKMNYSYPVSAVDTTTTFYKQCISTINTTPALFRPVIMTDKAPDAANYWLWRKYYSTRMDMMKTAMSLAFKDIDDKFRVGFTTILKLDVKPDKRMLDVKDFDKDQKETFYYNLSQAVPLASTPLRGALQKAGRYYAKKMPDQTYDPVQYSCQKNFLILSTDGYWNTYDEAADYGPYTVDGTATVDNQDGIGTPRPYFEGGAQITKNTYRWTVKNTWVRTSTTPISYSETVNNSYKQQQQAYAIKADSTYCKASPYKYLETTLRERTATYKTVTSYTKRVDTNNVSQVETWQRTDTTTNAGASTVTSPGTPSLVSSTSVKIESSAADTSYVSSVAPEAFVSAGSWSNVSVTKGVCTTSVPSPNPSAIVTVDGPTFVKKTTSGSLTTATGSATNVDGLKTAEAGAESLYGSTDKTTGATTNTLADLAMYYYNTDLRTPELDNCTGALDKDVCENNVKPLAGERDKATHQHLTTYTISLGNSGTLRYNKDYLTVIPNEAASIYNDYYYLGDETGDVAARKGTRDWSNPSGGGATRIDDLWHAAVNGRGMYFSATDPNSLAYSLKKALSEITKVRGTSAAAATSTLQPVAGDNGIYISQFTSPAWTGDLRKYRFNDDGSVTLKSVSSTGEETDTAVWSAAAKLTKDYTRRIYFFRPGSGATGSLQNFDAANMTSAEQTLFSAACTRTATADRLSQCATADATTLAALNSAATMVDYLRGQPKTGYRPRDAVLGDLVNSSPVFVGKPGFKYLENDYATWASSEAMAKRQRTLLVGGNDGMLHAFKDADDATGGTEMWAYVPRLVMDNMYKLADMNYGSQHRYFVDGTPVVSDIVGPEGKWRTIVVGGLNAGGRGYYALDITDPVNPVAMWEFGPGNLPAGQEGRLGYTFGNPIVTKAKDGTWVVVFTSGHNNPDGGGYLFVVNANTGELIKTLSTGVGDASNPSGLSRINAWINSPAENKALRFYGGDLTGRLYRFDPDSRLALPKDVVELAQFQITDTVAKTVTPQPITTMPMLAEFNANGAVRQVIYVGTGKYLGASDVPASSTSGEQQSVYAVLDKLTDTGYGDMRAGTDLVKQPVDTSSTPRIVGSKDTLMDWSKKKGWYMDFVSKAERVNVDMLLVANTLVAVGNVPGKTSSDCAAPGSNSAWMYLFNIITGGGNSTSLGTMMAGLGAVEITSSGSGTGTGTGTGTGSDTGAGTSRIKLIGTTTEGGILTPDIEPLTAGANPARRSSWRELR